MEAERLRDENLLKSANALEDFNRRATESYNRFALLEASAKKAFGGYGGFKKLLASDREWPQPDLSADENQLLEQLQQLEKKLENDLHRFRTRFPAFVFRFLPIWLWAVLLLGFAVAVPAFQHFGIKGLPMSYAGISAGAFVVVFIGYLIGGKQNSAPAREIAGNLAKSRWWLNACFEKAKTRAQQEQLRFRNETADAIHGMNQQWKHSVKEAIEMRGVRPIKIGEKAQRAFQKNEHIHEVRLQRLNNDFAMTRAHLRAEAEHAAKGLAEAHQSKMARLQSEFDSQWSAMESEWKQIVEPIYASIRAANEFAEKLFPPWEIPLWQNWDPPLEFKNAAKFGTLEVDMAKAAEAVPRDQRLALPGPENISIPLLLSYPLQGSILFEATKTGHEDAIAAINNIIFRLLSTNPPGKLSFTIFDPVGLGQNFAGAHAPGRLRGKPHQQPHLDADRADRGKARRAERAHGEGHPDVSPQRIRNHRRIQRAGRQHRREISFPRRRRFPGELQRDRRPSACATSPPAARAAGFTC